MFVENISRLSFGKTLSLGHKNGLVLHNLFNIVHLNVINLVELLDYNIGRNVFANDSSSSYCGISARCYTRQMSNTTPPHTSNSTTTS